ncbi:hypothetical protein EVAR_65558_1 [Eumeta japonica]|uniref:Uncharacterized protein n=1 Tax=Eumeta variegata TaxID=151549 RepID=A0A4C1ZBU5_EUMVA|nr:hypothetical protein EVAR_65558_1 [Eumeta japonica]
MRATICRYLCAACCAGTYDSATPLSRSTPRPHTPHFIRSRPAKEHYSLLSNCAIQNRVFIVGVDFAHSRFRLASASVNTIGGLTNVPNTFALYIRRVLTHYLDDI